MILRNTGDVRRALRSQLLQRAAAKQRDVLRDDAIHHSMHFPKCVCVCVFTCRSMWTYLKPVALGTFGIHLLLLMCYQHSSFFSNGAASGIVHKAASASLKSPLSQNSSGPLYLTDARESLSHHGNTSQSATATDNGINKDGRPPLKSRCHFLFL